jgi:hypothetical protein
MDPTIIAAIIGAIAAIVAALIGTVKWKHKVTTSKECFEKSKWLRLGYMLAALECYLDAQKMGIGYAIIRCESDYLNPLETATADTDLSTALEVVTKRAYETGKELGISVDLDASTLIRELPPKLDAKPIAMKYAFRIGHIIGHIYIHAIIQQGYLPLDHIDIEKLGEAERLLRGANFPSDFLKTVRELWESPSYESFKRETKLTIDDPMEDVLDRLCKDIETDFRHGR